MPNSIADALDDIKKRLLNSPNDPEPPANPSSGKEANPAQPDEASQPDWYKPRDETNTPRRSGESDADYARRLKYIPGSIPEIDELERKLKPKTTPPQPGESMGRYRERLINDPSLPRTPGESDYDYAVRRTRAGFRF